MADDQISVNDGSDRAVVIGDPNAKVVADKDSGNKESDGFVRKQAYEEVSKDMHKYKSRIKETEARAIEAEAKLKAIEEQKLKDASRYEELYENEKQARVQAEQTRQKDRELYLRAVKLSALKAELGEVRDEYLSHAPIDDIQLNDDGSLVSESVREVANNFRQDHPALIPVRSSGNITNYASPSSFQPTSDGDKPLSSMSYQEKAEYLKKLKTN